MAAPSVIAARDSIIEDLEWLVDGDERNPETLAARIGWTKTYEALHRKLVRAGRRDLAVLFNPAVRAEEYARIKKRREGTQRRGDDLDRIAAERVAARRQRWNARRRRTWPERKAARAVAAARLAPATAAEAASVLADIRQARRDPDDVIAARRRALDDALCGLKVGT